MAAGSMTKFCPLTSLLKSCSPCPSWSSCDVSAPYVTSLLVNESQRRVYMADYVNRQIKVASLDHRDRQLSALSLELVRPFKMTAVNEEMLAVTSNQGLLLLDVTGDPQVKAVLKTSRVYRGVAGYQGQQLVVSCAKDGDGAASVDVLDLQGRLLRTVLDAHTLARLRSPARYQGSPEDWLADLRATCDCPGVWDLTSPSALWLWRDLLLVADDRAPESGLTRADLATGRLRPLPPPLMTSLARPCDVSGDAWGGVYVAAGQSVLAMAGDGEWREMLSGWTHGEGECVWPVGLGVTDTGLLVSWSDGRRTVVKRYHFA